MSGGADDAAQRLLGAVLATGSGLDRASGMIVETEAYLGPHDDASHAAARTGRTKRNEAMFGPPGSLYVYISHGIHHCANVVTGEPGYPAAVLIRALAPTGGEGLMTARRGRSQDLCTGPGRLAQALGISMADNGVMLNEGRVRLEAGRRFASSEIGHSPRIGISRAKNLPLRFFVRGHPDVRRPRW
ncbi:MAG: DNA-3-methyladenine glycosylase [Longimicrobiales bacterium]